MQVSTHLYRILENITSRIILKWHQVKRSRLLHCKLLHGFIQSPLKRFRSLDPGLKLGHQQSHPPRGTSVACLWTNISNVSTVKMSDLDSMSHFLFCIILTHYKKTAAFETFCFHQRCSHVSG